MGARALPVLSFGQMLRLTLLLLVVRIMSHMSPSTKARSRRADMGICTTLVCLPLLRPIVSIVADRLACWRKPKDQHKQVTAFPPDMLPQLNELKRPWGRNSIHILDPTSSVPPATYDPTPRDFEAV